MGKLGWGRGLGKVFRERSMYYEHSSSPGAFWRELGPSEISNCHCGCSTKVRQKSLN